MSKRKTQKNTPTKKRVSVAVKPVRKKTPRKIVSGTKRKGKKTPSLFIPKDKKVKTELSKLLRKYKKGTKKWNKKIDTVLRHYSRGKTTPKELRERAEIYTGKKQNRIKKVGGIKSKKWKDLKTGKIIKGKMVQKIVYKSIITKMSQNLMNRNPKKYKSLEQAKHFLLKKQKKKQLFKFINQFYYG